MKILSLHSWFQSLRINSNVKTGPNWIQVCRYGVYKNMAAISSKYPIESAQEHILMCEKHNVNIDITCEDCDEFKYLLTMHQNRPQGSLLENDTHSRKSKENRPKEDSGYG